MNHNKEKSRFEEELNGQNAIIDYNFNNGVFDLHHTEVPKELKGRGIATKLTREVLGYIKKQGYKLKPTCPFIEDYISEHPEYKRLIAE